MTVLVFAGPTVAARHADSAIDAVWLAPAARGDVHRAVTLLRPRAIGIVDGYFQWVPSVHHKEILWALTRGVHVYGSGSMGALRAAELADFGMIGVGRVFEAYLSRRAPRKLLTRTKDEEQGSSGSSPRERRRTGSGRLGGTGRVGQNPPIVPQEAARRPA